MTIVELKPANKRNLIGDLPVVERTPQQEKYHKLMKGIDCLKFSSDIEINGKGVLEWKKEVSFRNLGGLSESANNHLGRSRGFTIFVEFDEDESRRRLSLRGRKRGVGFIFDIKNERFTPQIGERIGGINGEWKWQNSDEILVSDALLIVEKGIN